METKREIVVINGVTGESKNYTVSSEPKMYTLIKLGDENRPATFEDIEDLKKQLTDNIDARSSVIITRVSCDISQFKI